MNARVAGQSRIKRFDMADLANRKRAEAERVVEAPPAPPAPPAVEAGDVKRLEELIDKTLDKVKELRLAGMINKQGADFIQMNLIKCIAVIEGMK